MSLLVGGPLTYGPLFSGLGYKFPLHFVFGALGFQGNPAVLAVGNGRNITEIIEALNFLTDFSESTVQRSTGGCNSGITTGHLRKFSQESPLGFLHNNRIDPYGRSRHQGHNLASGRRRPIVIATGNDNQHMGGAFLPQERTAGSEQGIVQSRKAARAQTKQGHLPLAIFDQGTIQIPEGQPDGKNEDRGLTLQPFLLES